MFECMIQNLFQEYRFFPQYREKELVITANLFGVLVLQNILPDERQLELLQMVLEALKKDPNRHVTIAPSVNSP